MRGYTYRDEAGVNVARARGVEIPISPKKTYEVLNAIRGLPLAKARTLLEDVGRAPPRDPVPPLQSGDGPQARHRSGPVP